MPKIKLDESTLPSDGMRCRYQLVNTTWKEGIYDEEMQMFMDSEEGGDFDFAWAVIQWEEIKEVNKV